MADPNVMIDGAQPHRPKKPPFGPEKVIKKTTGLYKSKRFHIQLLLLLSVAIVSLVFGIRYVHNCPIQPKIPIFLIVQGTVLLLILIIHVVAFVYILYITIFKYYAIGIIAIFTAFLCLFLFIWFILGNVWTFSAFNHVQFTNETITISYCHGTLYQASFWLIISQYLVGIYFCLSFIWIPQSAHSPTNGIIKVRKQIPKIKRMLKLNSDQPSSTVNTISMRF
ncbi:unnamed protein product [Adineta steineri]|uniref:Uncharacterized protein n=1 Tax=Adineta steineri TaxID=433720 RepID=A0A815G722_9BILA|nr:unnamed protein product [Adineta steineri]